MLRATSHRYFGWFGLSLTVWLSGCASLPSEVQLIWRAPAGSGPPDATSEPDASLGLKLLVKIIGPFAPSAL